MYTLGINAAYHDPAACLVRDGAVVAAAEEERFTHVKHGNRPRSLQHLRASLPCDRLLPEGSGHQPRRRGPRCVFLRPAALNGRPWPGG